MRLSRWLFRRNNRKQTTGGETGILRKKPFILLPLYIYPSVGAWDPLFDVLRAMPELHIKVIINPSNGPGPYPPNCDYLAALETLSRFSNVEIFGYVHVSWGDRGDAEIQQDIAIYGSWAQMKPTPITVSGIFFDEWPSDIALLPRMSRLCVYTRSALALVSGRDVWNRQPSIICNPGTVVDDCWYFQPGVDYLVAFENTADMWFDPAVGGRVMCLNENIRNKTIALLHSARTASEHDGLQKVPGFSMELSHSLAGVFWTTGDFNSWCPLWGEFANQVSTC